MGSRDLDEMAREYGHEEHEEDAARKVARIVMDEVKHAFAEPSPEDMASAHMSAAVDAQRRRDKETAWERAFLAALTGTAVPNRTVVEMNEGLDGTAPHSVARVFVAIAKAVADEAVKVMAKQRGG